MDSPAVVEENGMDVRLELSLGLCSNESGSRKRVRVEAVEGKKPKMEEGLVPYGLQFMPAIFLGMDGYCYVTMMPCWVPSSVDVVQNCAYKMTHNQSLVVEMDAVVAGDCQVDVTGESSSSEKGNSRTSILQPFYKGESSNTTND